MEELYEEMESMSDELAAQKYQEELLMWELKSREALDAADALAEGEG